jgi:carbon storage regulator
MLVLTRKVGQTLVIGDNVTVTVVAITNGKVRVGIEAPRDVRVDRREIHERRTQQPLEPPPPANAAATLQRKRIRRSHLVKPSLP